MIIQNLLDKEGNNCEKYIFGLNKTKENEMILLKFIKNVENLFCNEECNQKSIDLLEKSEYKIRLEERDGKSLTLVRINEEYYRRIASFGPININLKRLLDLKIYE